MNRPLMNRAGLSALAVAIAAALSVTVAPAAHAVGENSRCTVNWSPNFGAEVSKNGWNYRTGPGTGYLSRGLLYRGDDVKVFCSRGSWNYSELTHRSKSGMPKGTKGWVHDSGLYHLAG